MNIGSDLSFFSLIMGASLPVQLVMLILIAASVVSWKFIYLKVKILKESEENTNEFEKFFWSGGDLKPGEKMNILGTIAKSDDFESYESEVYKPLIEKEIIKGNHRWWALSKIYERTENAYGDITHMFFNVGVEGADNTEGWQKMQSTFKGQKLIEGLQAASDHQSGGQLELVSIHN